MTNQEAVLQLTALKGQQENEAMAIGIALELLTDIYRSDKTALDMANTRIEALEEENRQLREAATSPNESEVEMT